MRVLICINLLLFGASQPAFSEVVLAKRTIPSHTILQADDFVVEAGSIPGVVSNITEILGLESRKVLYRGRPVSRADVAPMAIIERNQIVTLVFLNGTLAISADARSLGRAAAGDHLRVMNLQSKITVSGIVSENGTVLVGP